MSDLHADLNAYMSDVDDGFADFVIDGKEEPTPPQDVEKANAMLRRYRRFEAELLEINQLAAAEIERIEQWRDDRAAGIEKAMLWLERSLEGYARATNRDDPKRKTLSMPNGALRLRAARQRLIVDDEDALVEWATKTDERARFVRVTRSPMREEIKKACKPGPVIHEKNGERTLAVVTPEGEAVPGVYLVEHVEPTFSMEAAK